jgi:hypothetical protein
VEDGFFLPGHVVEDLLRMPRLNFVDRTAGLCCAFAPVGFHHHGELAGVDLVDVGDGFVLVVVGFVPEMDCECSVVVLRFPSERALGHWGSPVGLGSAGVRQAAETARRAGSRASKSR